MLGARMLMSAARRHAYRDVVLADSPIGYWRLDETSGTIAADASGNGLDGTYRGGPTLGQAPLINSGKSVSFDGVNDGVDVDSQILNLPGDVTLEAWICADSLSGIKVWMAFIVAGESEDTNTIHSLRTIDGEIDMFWEYGNNSTNLAIPSGVSLSTATIYHLVAARDDAEKQVNFYVNGSLRATKSYTNSATGGTSSKFFIGNADDDVLFFVAGRMDEVAVYSSVLSGSRVSAHYSAGVGA